LETGRERAIALITATLNLRYGDGDTELFEQALTDASAGRPADDAVRELAQCAGTLANMVARKDEVDTLEWWSAIAKRITIEGSELEQALVTPVMRAAYTLAACSVVADEIPADGPTTETERDLLLSQVNETINALRRLRRRLA
jgi:hypothetical protein